ncbi:early endosome antigen 1-like [Macrobrachium rosenbergii]|uniref:early endosome antigen 1-like n=1 Tax=Macrobrachium rosenbergii TaxID=79674 RepID=UPI0034D4BD09
MEAGGNNVNLKLGQQFDGHTNLNNSSEVFDVVVDPLTDFKVIELSSEPSSPQQSFNLPSSVTSHHSASEGTLQNLSPKPPTPSPETSSQLMTGEVNKASSLPSSPYHPGRTLRNIFDTNIWSSDVSLSSGSGTSSTGCARDRAGSSGVGGGSSNHHRLVVPEVHRFGYNPPCAGSPHDLASCPVASVSATQKGPQAERLSAGNKSQLDERYDALKALSQASSALALTETLIGPLKIPPVSQEVIDEVVCNMEKKKSSLSFIYNGSAPEKERNASNKNPTGGSIVQAPENNATPDSVLFNSSIGGKNSIGSTIYGAKIPVSSLSSVLEPDIHKISRNGKVQDSNSVPHIQINANNTNKIDVKGSSGDPVLQIGRMASSREGLSTSRVIAVPVGMSDHGPVEVYKEVHPYPASSITTVVERCSYIGQTQVGTRPPSGTKRRKKLKNKKGKEPYLSHSSLASGSSACSSVASDCTVVSKNSSELTPTTRSVTSSSKLSLNDSRSDCGGPVSKPILSAAIMQMRQALESVSNVSDNRSDKSSGGGLEIASNFSDTSSNLSTLSDLSGYEDEYIRIKKLVSDAVIPPEDYKKLLDKTNAKSQVSKPVPSVDYEKIIRDLHAQKEDLEIQLHRLSIQVQNAVREKELYQQQLELMNTKITETNQKQYFEVLKQRANVEGQLEMLKQELENSVYEKSQLQAKVTDSLKEVETSKSIAAAAKEAESTMSARLLKFEDANKDLEKQLKIANDELEKISREFEKTTDDLAAAHDKNINLEQSVMQLQEKDSSMMAEIKGLKSRVTLLQEECQTHIHAEHKAEAVSSKISSELEAAQKSSLWYQEQLHLSQTARSCLQQELVEARSSVAKLTSEKEALDLRVQTLVREAEDGQARAVREKASLVAHLEALQADMAEREALVSQMERDRGNDTKLMEDRRQRLEQDRHRIHKLRLDLSDAERQLESLKDDLKHKCILISKYEKELKDLRTLEAVNQEVLAERDARILNLEQALSENKLLLSNAQHDVKQKVILISSLKEEKSKLEVSLVAANNEKREVDDAIIKVREDMTKLSSNFYRMKHDIAAKDRQLEVFKKEVETLNQLKDSTEKKYELLELKMQDKVEEKKYAQEIESLKKESKELLDEKVRINKELNEALRTLKTLEIEKKGLNEAVRLREEQIQNMQGSLENYREAILKKDEELYVINEQNSSMEKSYAELRRNWDALKEDNIALRQEAEAYTEHEKAQKRELFDLRESVQKERKLKQNLEKKMEKALKSQEEDRLRMENEKSDLEKKSQEISCATKVLKEENLRLLEAIEELKNDHAEVCRELLIEKEEKDKIEIRLKECVSEFDTFKQGSTNSAEMVKVLESRMEVLLRENSEITNRLSSVQNEYPVKISELENLLQVKEKGIVDANKIIVEKDFLVAKLNQEKVQSSAQVKNVLEENDQLKKKILLFEDQNKESKSQLELSESSGKKQGRNKDLLKEINVLQARCQDTETKLKEMTKQKENLQTTMKNTKRESLLMKAKMKEFESLKAKCKELESSKVSSQDLQAFELKCTEIESKLKSEEEKVLSLEASLTDKEHVIDELEQKGKDLASQICSLNEVNKNLQLKVTALEDICQKSKEEITQYQTRLKVVENDKDEWMVKYESLRDIIPERDTSTQPAVQLGFLDSQVLSSSQERLSVSPLDTSTAISGAHTGVGFLGDMSKVTIANGSQFDKTMADLQAQVNLTSKALQSKEQQICELQNQISLLQLGECSSSNPSVKLEDLHAYKGEMIPMQIHQQQVQSLLEKVKELQAVKECIGAAKKEPVSAKDVVSDEVQELLKKVKDLESSLDSKQNELDKSETKISEFQEKHRRYESNVRLLTRKLKEHMKGRKSAEKEIQLQAENHQSLMNEEHQRYSVLRCRCIELEGRCESLEGQVGSLETEVEEVRAALNSSRQEAQEHHQNTLMLQKEIGRLQELTKTADTLRSEVSKCEKKLNEKEIRIKELETELQTLDGQFQENQTSTEALKCKFEQQQSEALQLKNQRIKVEENIVVNQALKDLESSRSELSEKLLQVEEKYRQSTVDVQGLQAEQLKLVADKEILQTQLRESIARNNTLENHIKVVDGELEASKKDVLLSKERLLNLESSHQAKITQLEESINRSRQEVVTLSSQLGQVQKERVSYQNQATELRVALQSTLAQLKNFEAEEEARVAIQTEVGVIPSPSPLDLTALTELMERSVRPVRSEAPLSSLQSCLSSLKAEVATLQSQLQTKGKELDEGSGIEEKSEAAFLPTNAVSSPAPSSSSTEIV